MKTSFQIFSLFDVDKHSVAMVLKTDIKTLYAKQVIRFHSSVTSSNSRPTTYEYFRNNSPPVTDSNRAVTFV